MALTSPALTLATEAMFGNIKPALDLLKRLGPTDFSAGAPEYVVKPGATIKVPVSSIAAAQAYDDSTNNYLTGGATDWASLTCAHYLQGFDISGVNVDQGVDKARMEQLFTRRAGTGIAYAVQGALTSALDGATVSTGVKIPAVGSATLDSYMGLATAKSWYTGFGSALVVNGTEYANIKSLFAAKGIVGSEAQLASYLGFKDLIVVPGMTARAVIVPDGAMGFLGRVPALIANYPESGVETDADTGLSVGIVIADDQAHNKRVANADLWFGAYLISANAAASTAGAIKVGTSA
jgi:hypothetical protein